MTDKDGQVCKMFVGGLSLNTTDDSLRDYFSKWGEITDAVVMKEPGTKRSRGFGFVTYASADSVDEVLQDKPHVVDDKEVECKRAVPREEKNPQAHQRTKKVFLGGLSPETTKQDILDVIEQYGKVNDVQIMTEKNTNKPRGFGFAILDSYDDVDKLCIKKYHRIKDRDVEVKKAISQEEMRKAEQSKNRPSGGDSGYPGYYPPMRDSPYRGGPPYGGRGGGYDSYRMSGYDYPASRYPGSDYMRSAGDYYGMGGFGERGAASAGYAAASYGAYRYPGHTGYDMNAYTNMYGQGAGMGSYSQTASSYGPNRGYGGGGVAGDAARGDKDGRGGAAKYHPYRRN